MIFEIYSKSLFICRFLDDVYLFAIPKGLVLWYLFGEENITIPCRPTSPDVLVTLTKDGKEVCLFDEY